MRDRDEAEQRFRSCVAMNRVGIFDVAWSAAYLKRMEEDPAWPSWLKSEDATAGESGGDGK